MAHWQGKSRGSVLGLRIYVFFIKTFGLYFSYFVLLFVAAYFIVFSFNSTKSTFYLFRKRLNYSIFWAALNVYKSYFTFGKIQLDRIAIASGSKNKYSFEFDGIQYIQDLLKQGRGGILLTAHIGNFNLAKHFFDDQVDPTSVNLVLSDFEHQQIKNYLESVTGKASLKTIVLKDDLSHIFEMRKALDRNELLVFAADRYLKDAKTYNYEFLMKETQFPQGPFKLAVRNAIPVLFVHIMREKNFHYHFYARPATGNEKTGKELLKLYLENLETMVKKYPHQWYNYYDYWNDFN
ncbi:lipid A biosynthesis acyltransferase [Gillisia limnaea]|uniref:Lipid A biosynthesis acyltransferase n=1 Tax=Gillisia limnaea (strain DSM 15749 / LMG 21470 / R-8282) TaxID=865937 RepID=H2BV14_GILLR|nr:lipid A biosynthesis acyltransferase [Gillisia limnaea]EHQ03904.1 lipid A biosynthesis acyltransferase [Gillisia limnaea DSM 15749]